MPRATSQWIGETDDARPPERVRVRVFRNFYGRCQCGCRRKIGAGERWDLDHIVALINGGANAEWNLQPLLTEHHKAKTAADVAEKSKVATVAAKHLGLRKSSRHLPCGRDSGLTKTMQGGVVPRRTQIEKHRDAMAARQLVNTEGQR